MARETYEAQVALLVRALPHVAGENVFALKGGTAINLFYRDLPRLSVDIDLTYLPIKDRAESLDEINAAMDRIAAAIETGIRGAKSQRIQGGGGGATREDVALFKANVAPHVKIKAAGGIANLDDARDFIALGADRLGTSRIVKAVKALEQE